MNTVGGEQFRTATTALVRWRRRRASSRLAGKHVVITGASSGIGRATALAVAGHGAVVLAVARRSDLLAELVADIHGTGGRAYAFTCDVTDPHSVAATTTAILRDHSHVDYLVNNAGRSIRRSVYASVERMHDYERVMAVNFFGSVRMTMAFLPHWRSRGFGHVVNVSTIGVQARNPYFSAYLASKSALDAFASVAGTETLSDNITFTSVHMPLVKTAMSAPSGESNPWSAMTAEQAAVMVVRALVNRPTRIDTKEGTVSELWGYLAPKSWRRKLHRVYIAYPDSSAATGSLPSS